MLNKTYKSENNINQTTDINPTNIWFSLLTAEYWFKWANNRENPKKKDNLGWLRCASNLSPADLQQRDKKQNLCQLLNNMPSAQDVNLKSILKD